MRLLRMSVVVLAMLPSSMLPAVPAGAVPGAAHGGWQRRSLVHAGFEAGAYVIDVAAGGPGLIAVGTRLGPRHALPAVWSSADGVHWKRAGTVGLPQRLGPSPAHVAAHGKTTVVTTFPHEGDSARDMRTREWWSRDLDHWHAADGAAKGAAFNDVVGSPDGFVAVGTVAMPDSRFAAAAWFSRDGRSWQRADIPPSVGAPGDAGLGRVARTGSGFVALGRDGGAIKVITSADGRAWRSEAVTLPDSFVDIGGGPDGVVVITEPPTALGGSLWFSHDGQTWLSQPGYRKAFPSGSPDDLTKLRHTWVVAGSTPSARGSRTFGAWTSRDLETWTAMPSALAGRDSSGPITAEGVQLAAIGNRVVIFSTGLNPRWFWTWTAP